MITRNRLSIKIYSSGTTEAPDIDRSLSNALVEAFGTVFPGGVFSTARIFVPRDVRRAWLVAEGQRLAIFNGLNMVWEGEIGEIAIVVQAGQQGNRLECVGKWGALLGNRTWNKVWADIRLSDGVWVQQGQGDKDDQVNVDRMSRLSIGPQAVAWSAGEVVAAFRYTMPTGEVIRRIKATLKNRGSGQDWTTRLRDTVGGSTLASESGDGATSVHDVSLGTPRQYIEFQLVSNAAQTPTNAYGRLSAVTVYSETGGITPTSVLKNIRAKLAELNVDETLIGSNTFALEPFMSQGAELMSGIAQRAAAFGDTSYNAWAAWLEASDRAASPNGKPVLAFAAYPSLSDYDYAIGLGDANVVAPIELKRAVSGAVYNWLIVRYRDELANRDVILTPDDDAALMDTTSIDRWGQRELVIDAGTATAMTAKNYARRVLAAKKDAKYRVSSPINVKGWIRDRSGVDVDVSLVRAGQRIRILNFLTDEVGVDGAGLTFIITGTEYTPGSQTMRISTGVPDSLAVYLAQRALLDDRKLA